MDRRSFLRAIGAGGAVAWLMPNRKAFAGQNTEPVYATPVPFVKDPSAANLTQSDLSALFTVDAALTTQNQSAIYPQSVASGDPASSGIVLWTRIPSEAQTGPDPNTVAWQ